MRTINFEALRIPNCMYFCLTVPFLCNDSSVWYYMVSVCVYITQLYTALTEQQQQQQYYTQCNVHIFCIRLKVFMETFYKMFGVMLGRREKCSNPVLRWALYTSSNTSSQLLRLPRAFAVICARCVCLCAWICLWVYTDCNHIHVRAHNESFRSFFAKIMFVCAMTTKTNMLKSMDLIFKPLPRMPSGNIIYIVYVL